MSYASFIPILAAIRELQLKYDFLAQADQISRLIDLAHLELPDFVREITSGDTWGGAGSVADLAFLGNVDAPEAQLLKDELAYARLLVKLVDEMRANGIRHEPAELAAELKSIGIERLRAQIEGSDR